MAKVEREIKCKGDSCKCTQGGCNGFMDVFGILVVLVICLYWAYGK